MQHLIGKERTMREKTQGAHIDSATADQHQSKRQQPGTEGADAIDPSGDMDKAKLKENQKRLDVEPDHKTTEMKKGGRGTFP
jgi:hypothetical protein